MLTRLFLSASAASAENASTKYPPNSVVYCSAPLRVAVMIVRPGPESSSTNGPLELAVFTNTTLRDGTLAQQRVELRRP